MSKIKLALINGYPESARLDFERYEVPQAQDLFCDLFNRALPEADFDIFYPADPNGAMPGNLNDYAGFLWTGSNGTIYKDLPENTRQLELMKAMFETDRPIWGSCWGLQVAVLAAGGEVQACKNGREWISARKVRLNADGVAHDMFQGKASQFDALVMHTDEVSRLPDNAKLLAGNGHSDVQAIELQLEKTTFWGTQYHPEFTFPAMGRLIISRAPAIIGEGLKADQGALDDTLNRLFRIGEAIVTHPELTREDLADNKHSIINGDGDMLDLGWTIFNTRMKELEILNWIETRLKPSL